MVSAELWPIHTARRDTTRPNVESSHVSRIGGSLREPEHVRKRLSDSHRRTLTRRNLTVELSGGVNCLLMFNVLLDTEWVLPEMLLPAGHDLHCPECR